MSRYTLSLVTLFVLAWFALSGCSGSSQAPVAPTATPAARINVQPAQPTQNPQIAAQATQIAAQATQIAAQATQIAAGQATQIAIAQATPIVVNPVSPVQATPALAQPPAAQPASAQPPAVLPLPSGPSLTIEMALNLPLGKWHDHDIEACGYVVPGDIKPYVFGEDTDPNNSGEEVGDGWEKFRKERILGFLGLNASEAASHNIFVVGTATHTKIDGKVIDDGTWDNGGTTWVVNFAAISSDITIKDGAFHVLVDPTLEQLDGFVILRVRYIGCAGEKSGMGEAKWRQPVFVAINLAYALPSVPSVVMPVGSWWLVNDYLDVKALQMQHPLPAPRGGQQP